MVVVNISIIAIISKQVKIIERTCFQASFGTSCKDLKVEVCNFVFYSAIKLKYLYYMPIICVEKV